MSIDEAIAKYKEITNTDANCPAHCNISCDKCVQESEQLAEWLEELKMLRELKNEHRKIGNIEGFNKGYDKAIDDFKSRLEERILAGKMIDEKFAYIDNCDIDEIAEHLKAGGENDNLRR